MSVKSVSLTDVVVSDMPTHIVIYREGDAPKSSDMNMKNMQKMQNKVDDLMTLVEKLSKRILHLELAAEVNSRIETEMKTTPFFGSSIVPEPTGLHVRRLSDVCDDSKTTFRAIINGLTPPPNVQASTTKNVSIASHVEEIHEEVNEEEEQEVQEEEQEQEEVEEAEAEEDVEDADADADADAAVEFEEFEYKGTTYYKDPENLVYKLDDDGDLDDSPIGIWSEEKKKVLRYKQ
jgi:hypothetical protein